MYLRKASSGMSWAHSPRSSAMILTSQSSGARHKNFYRWRPQEEPGHWVRRCGGGAQHGKEEASGPGEKKERGDGGVWRDRRGGVAKQTQVSSIPSPIPRPYPERKGKKSARQANWVSMRSGEAEVSSPREEGKKKKRGGARARWPGLGQILESTLQAGSWRRERRVAPGTNSKK